MGLLLAIGIGYFIFSNNTVEAYTQEEYKQKLNESVAYAMSLLDDDMSDQEKAIILAQYCQEGNQYGFGPNHQTPEGVLVDHLAVCAGYASSLTLLLQTAGIPAIQINNDVHAWVLAYVDGKWCYIDATKGVSTNGAYQICNFFRAFATEEQLEATIGSADPYYFNGTEYPINSSLDVFPETDGSYYGKLGYNSRVYYDEDYKYYIDKDLVEQTCALYKENRKTGEKTELAVPLYSYKGAETGLVKDGDTLYYVGTDSKSLWSIQTDGSNNRKVLTITDSSKNLGGVFVSDGYIQYVLYNEDSSTDYEGIKYKEISTAVKTGSQTYNTTNRKYTLEYITTSRGAVITNCIGINSSEPEGEFYIPSTLGGMSVIGIAEGAFEDVNLTGDLVLPSTLEYIGESAFENTQVESITFNHTIQSIGAYAFCDCTQLKEIDMPNSVTNLGLRAFDGCTQVEELTISEGLVYLPEFAFWGINLSGVVEIPEGVQVMDYGIFNSCKNIQAAILPESLTILENVFYGADKLEDVWIQSENMQSINFGSTNPNVYLPTGTKTASIADESDLSYKDDTTLSFSNAVLTINNVTEGIQNISNLLIELGKQVQLEAEISPKFWVGYPVTWNSSSSSISIDNTGKITANTEDTATITATYNGKTASIQCTAENFNTVKLDISQVALYQQESQTVKIIEGATSGSTIEWKMRSKSNQEMEYDITDSAITKYVKVELSSDKRSATITAIDAEVGNYQYELIAYVDGRYKGKCDISVLIPITSVRIGPNSPGISISFNGVSSSMKLDYENEETKNFALKFNYYPQNASEGIENIIWTVENENILQNNGQGSFTVLRGGETKIIATMGEYQAILTVTVENDNEHSLTGDVNQDGTIDMLDYVLILSHVRETKLLSGEALTLADVNHDGNVDMLDYVLVLSHVRGTKLLV